MNLIIDGNNIATRSHFKMPHLRSSSGTFTGAIHGFLITLLRLKRIHNPKNIIVCWDGGRSSWRMKLCPSYKANRDKSKREEVYAHFKILRGMLDLIPVANVFVEGVEADDLIAKFVIDRPEEDHVIVSNDKDFIQLVCKDRVRMLKSDDLFYSTTELAADLGCNPSDYILVKSLMGDGSDNIPGLAKIGPKKAVKMIDAKPYGQSLEWLYSREAMILYSGMEKAIRELTAEDIKKTVHRNYRMMSLEAAAVMLPYVDFHVPKQDPHKWQAFFGLLERYDLNEVKSKFAVTSGW